MSIQAASLIATISVLGADKAKADIAGVGVESEALGSKMQGALAFGAVAAGAAIIGLGAKTVSMAGNFQAGITTLKTGAGELQGALGTASSGILKMAVDTGTSTSQLVAGMYSIDSAGYTVAKGGLHVLQVAAEGAKVGNADLGTVAYALSGILHNYHLSATDAAGAMNALTVTVGSGNMHLQDLASAMGAVLPTAAALGVSFPQVAGAIAVMTNATVSSQQASQNLAATLLALSAPNKVAVKAMAEVGLTAQQVKDALSHQGLEAALKLIEDHVGKTFPAGSVASVTALKQLLGGATGYHTALTLSGANMKAYETNIDNITAAMKKGAGGVAGWSDVQNTFNFKLSQAQEVAETLGIKIGTVLLPVVGNLISSLATNVISFASWVTGGTVVKDTLKFIGDNAQVTIPILAGLGAGIVALAVTSIPPLITAFAGWAAAAWTAAIPTLELAWPILAVAAAVAGLAAGFIALYNNNAGFKSFINGLVGGFQSVWKTVQENFLPTMQKIGAFLQANVLPILQQVGNFLVSTFQPVWQQLVALWNGQLLPAFKQMWGALQPLGDSFKQIWTQIQPLMPVIKMLGEIIGAVFGVLIVTTIGILVGLLKGAAQGIAGFFSGLATVIGGVVQIFTGVVQVIGGLVRFFVDLFTGQWSKLGSDLGAIWQGIINIFQGAWNVIVGIFQAAWGLVSGVIGGFVTGVIGFFQHLANELVGHSIIPDMWNAIVGWFTSIPNRIFGLVQNFVSQLIAHFNALKSEAIVIFEAIVQGIGNAFNKLGGLAQSAWNSVAGAIKGGINTIIGLINGFINGVDKIHITLPGGQSVGFSIPDIPYLAQGGTIAQGGMAVVGERGPETVWLPAGAQVIPHSGAQPAQQQPDIHVYVGLDGANVAYKLMPHIVSHVRYGVGARF